MSLKTYPHYQGEEFILHFSYKMKTTTAVIINEIPSLLGPSPNSPPSDFYPHSKYNLIGKTHDVGLNLERLFDLPTHTHPNGLQGIQPSLELITSETLLYLVRALIKIIGEDQVAFALWLRPTQRGTVLGPVRPRPKSFLFSYRIFTWPIVFVSYFWTWS